MNENVLSYLRDHRVAHVERACEWLRIPSVSADRQFDPHTTQAAQFIADHFKKIGLENITKLPTSAHDVIYADWCHAPGKPTILFYGHYDVQPPDPIDQWKTPAFEPTERDGFLHGRGTADDKGQVMMVCNALEAWFGTQQSLPVNIKCFIEGDEESGAAGSEALLREAKRLHCDAVLIADSPWQSPTRPTIYFGARGLSYFDLTIEGTRTDLHSGMYGNLIRNPVNVLCDAIAGLRDDNGHITIPGFYDAVVHPTPQELALLDETPVDAAAIAKTTGASAVVPPPKNLSLRAHLCTVPSFDVCGISGGYAGEGAKTIIPARAKAKLSFRLVPNQDPHAIENGLRTYLQEKLPPEVRFTLTTLNTGRAWATPVDDPFLQTCAHTVSEFFGVKAALLRLEASIPIVSTLFEVMQVPVILFGMGLPDDGIHSPFEKFSLDHYHRGAECYATLLHQLGQVRPQ